MGGNGSRWKALVALGVAVLAVGAFADPLFTDATDEAGIRFQHVDGRSGQKYFVETLGSGVALFDYDNDGDLDIYFVNGAPLPGYVPQGVPKNRLYRNEGNWKFTDVTDLAGVGDEGYGHGACVGDYDNDGDLDLYVTNFGPNVLYQNNGDGTFTDVSQRAGVADARWSSSAAFADYDQDGDLDLYVANYLILSLEENPWCGLKEKGVRAYCAPDQFPGQADALYRNNGDGTFTEVTAASGVLRPHGKGLGVSWGDYDNDGYPDLYVANDSTENFLFHNLRDGTFEEVGFFSGVAVGETGVMENGMGTDWGDYDNDGWLDLVVTNYADQMNTLYHNDGDGFFSDVSVLSGTGPKSLPYLAWGVEFFDYDNDGWLDLIVANGHLHDNLAALGQKGTYAQRNLLYHNRGDGTFEEVGLQSGPGMSLEEVSRGLAVGDLDDDGDLDVVISNSNGPARLLRNEGGNAQHWLLLRLIRRSGSSDAIGARVVLEAGGRVQIREVRSGSSYLSQSDLRVHFGLGEAERVDRLQVRWNARHLQQYENLPADRLLILEEGSPEVRD
ncbi:MAG: RNA-binding protein [Candidatus Poribacteria bacterium]|nr:MAG: RNA-binding protein [Candidatus Poribacteria bacterium]